MYNERNFKLETELALVAQRYPGIKVQLQPAGVAITVTLYHETRCFLSMFFEARADSCATVIVNLQSSALLRWMEMYFGESTEDSSHRKWLNVPMTFENIDKILNGYHVHWVAEKPLPWEIKTKVA